MRSPSKAMLRSPARGGHGSIMWVTLLAATASPAPKLTVSRRSRYISVQAPSRVVAASARIAANLFRDIDGLPLGDVENMADRGRAPVGAAADATVHRHGDFGLTEQEELGVIRRLCRIERRAQHVTWAGRAYEMRRHDDDEVGLFLLIGGAARKRTEH